MTDSRPLTIDEPPGQAAAREGIIGTGWAILGANDQVDVRTVAQHRRAAIVNWLVSAEGVFITNAWDDARIEKVWQGCSLQRGVRVEEIEVRLRRPAPTENEILSTPRGVL